jgi:hypothetical protein
VALAVLAAGAVPVLGFALFFESGSLERFLALYPFLDLSIAVALAMVPAAWGARVIVVFLATAAISDVHDIWRPRIEADQRRTLARALSLEANAHNGEIWMTSLSDKLIWAEDAFPFEDRTSLRDLQLDPVVQIGTTNVAHWRRDFALRSLGAWDSGRTVWLSRRLLADRPRPEWGWTEGETPDVSWNALRDFSRVLETDRDEGGDDGFLRLADTPANRHSLAALAAGPR